LAAVLEDRTDEYRVPAVNASIQITDMDPLTVHITESSDGVMYDIPLALRYIQDMYIQLAIPEVTLASVIEYPVVYSDDLEVAEDTVETVLSQFPMQIVYSNTSTRQTGTWTIYP